MVLRRDKIKVLAFWLGKFSRFPSGLRTDAKIAVHELGLPKYQQAQSIQKRKADVWAGRVPVGMENLVEKAAFAWGKTNVWSCVLYYAALHLNLPVSTYCIETKN